MLIMTENDVNPHIDNDPMEKRNEFIDHPSYVVCESMFYRDVIFSYVAIIIK